MKYVVLQTGGKQYKVSEGDIIEIEKIDNPVGKDFQFENVLLFTGEDSLVKIGQPILTDVIVTAKVLENIKGDKIRVGKYKAKVRYRRMTGHRQLLTKVQIEKITSQETKVSENTQAEL